MDVTCRPAPDERARCACCHGPDREEQGETCPRCAAILRVDCWEAAGRCPTLGCQTGAETGAEPAKASRWDPLIVLPLLALLLALALVPLLDHLVPGPTPVVLEQDGAGRPGRR